jgi:hypothetical protein
LGKVKEFRQEKLEKRLDELRVALAGTFRDINNEIDAWCRLEERVVGIVNLGIVFGKWKRGLTMDELMVQQVASTWWSLYEWYRDREWETTERAIMWVQIVYDIGNAFVRRMHHVRTHLPDCYLD